MGTGAGRPADAAVVLSLDDLDRLLGALADGGHQVVGPVVRDGAIVPAPVHGVADLPAGWTDEQAPGRYRLHRRDDGALFGHAAGPGSPKRWFLAPSTELWRGRVERDGDGTPVAVRLADPPPPPPPVALVGVKACDLAAVSVQDRVLANGDHPDPDYTSRRAGAVFVAVDCGDPAATCFCTSTGTGPVADGRGGDVVPDVRLTELVGAGTHRLVARAMTGTGRALLDGLGPLPAATPDDLAASGAVGEQAAARMARGLDVGPVAVALAGSPEHPRWDDVASRCVSCGNCTMVCPTCFCTSVEDTTDLSGDEVVRARRWDSCFTMEHSYLHGGSVHASVRSRYRQWLTHKLSTWWDQFGTTGCVGCGRCTTWCPVGIDLVEEARMVATPPTVTAVGAAGDAPTGRGPTEPRGAA